MKYAGFWLMIVISVFTFGFVGQAAAFSTVVKGKPSKAKLSGIAAMLTKQSALKNPAKTTGTTGKLKEFGKGCWPSGKKYYCRGAVQRVKKTNGIYGWLVSCEAVVAVKSTKISRTRYRISARVPSRLGCELKGIKSKARIPSWAGTTAYGRIESAYTVAALVAAADNLRKSIPGIKFTTNTVCMDMMGGKRPTIELIMSYKVRGWDSYTVVDAVFTKDKIDIYDRGTDSTCLE